MLDKKPNVIHYSGHGTVEGLLFEKNDKLEQ
jgi:hypothetical protein